MALATPSVPRTCCLEPAKFPAPAPPTDARPRRSPPAPCRPDRPAGADFHLARALFHHHDGLVGLGLDRLDQRGNILGGGARVLGQFADLVGNHGETAPSLAGARRLDGGVQRQQVRLLGNVVDHVDDLADFQRAVAQRLDLLGASPARERECAACLRACRARNGCPARRRQARAARPRRWLRRCWTPASSKP